MKKLLTLAAMLLTTFASLYAQKIFDTHIHGQPNPGLQIDELKAAGVYKAAVSTSWDRLNKYKSTADFTVLKGIMLACPNGKVPYSNQNCFEDETDFPDVKWVEQMIIDNKIQFIGEVLSQYYGISPSDERLHPYYALAEKHGIPVGIHTGLAGPDHESSNFRVSLGTPLLLEDLLRKYPKLKIWIMHGGAPFLEDTIAIMKYYSNVYADISALNNPYIFPPSEFNYIMKRLIDNGLEDRLMFGSDNGDITLAIQSVENLPFLTDTQKEKIFSGNAEVFFKR